MSENKKIYLDHAATTPLDEEILQKMLPYFTQVFGNANSQHAFGRSAMAILDDARAKIAELINAADNEIFFTSGGTEADNFAVFGAARAQKQLGRNKIFISALEHSAVRESAAYLAESEGFVVKEIPVNENGVIDIEFLKNAVDEKTALVAVMGASNELGTIQPIKEAAAAAHRVKATFFTDCVQYAPYIVPNVKELGADILSFSAHKFYGPKGTGILYIKNGTPTERLIVGGEQENGMRAGTVNVVGAVGAAAAYEKAIAQMSESNEKIGRIKELFLREITRLPYVHINGGDEGECVPSLLNVRFDGVDNSSLLALMDMNGIAASAGAACSGGDVRPSHALIAKGLTEEQAKNSIRFSFGKHNTEEEVIAAARTIAALADKLRR